MGVVLYDHIDQVPHYAARGSRLVLLGVERGFRRSWESGVETGCDVTERGRGHCISAAGPGVGGSRPAVVPRRKAGHRMPSVKNKIFKIYKNKIKFEFRLRSTTLYGIANRPTTTRHRALAHRITHSPRTIAAGYAADTDRSAHKGYMDMYPRAGDRRSVQFPFAV